MAWARKGDNAATHPAVLKIETDPDWDERLVNEAYGFWQRCVEHSAGHTTDGILTLGEVITLGGRSRHAVLVRTCVRSGLLTTHHAPEHPDGPAWKVSDDTDLVHIRTRAELEWEKARKLDIANPRLIVAVKRRDGDACRYCGDIVQWKARRGGRRGSYDHRPRGVPARTPDNLVVCCFTCNNRRNGFGDQADVMLPLLPAPADPFYSEGTVEYLAAHGVFVTQSRPSQQPGSISANDAQRPASADGTTEQPGSSSAPAQRPASAEEPQQRSADPAETRSTDRDGTGTGRGGSGRGGLGQAGSGRDGAGREPTRRRKRRRGRRGRGGEAA